MEMHERIRKLRKEHLGMSQTEFGKRLGVSRSVINNIELDVLARPDQKLSLIKLMCNEFGVSEEWLLNGNGPMFVEPDTFSLDQFVKDHGGTELELEIIKTYLEIDPEIRRKFVEHFRKRFLNSAPPATPEELEKRYPPEEDGQQTG